MPNYAVYSPAQVAALLALLLRNIDDEAVDRHDYRDFAEQLDAYANLLPALAPVVAPGEAPDQNAVGEFTKSILAIQNLYKNEKDLVDRMHVAIATTLTTLMNEEDWGVCGYVAQRSLLHFARLGLKR